MVVYRASSQSTAKIFFGSLVLIGMVINFATTLGADSGALPVQIVTGQNNPSVFIGFYEQVYTKPWFHLTSYSIGIIFSLAWQQHLTESSQAASKSKKIKVEHSLFGRYLNFMMHNVAPRYISYVIALGLMIGMICWQYPFIEFGNKSAFSCAMFATLAYPLFLVGVYQLIVMTLVGKAKFIKVIFGAQFWTVSANMSAASYMMFPVVCLFYYTTVEH